MLIGFGTLEVSITPTKFRESVGCGRWNRLRNDWEVRK